MRLSVFVGDITDVQADAVCTSTNPRLSLATEDRGDRFGLNLFRARNPGVCGLVHVDRARRGAR